MSRNSNQEKAVLVAHVSTARHIHMDRWLADWGFVQHILTCAFMLLGFRVAAAAVEAEADLRELSIDDWDSALEEAGDTLVVVDFFTNW